MDEAGYDTLQVIAKANHFNRWMYEEINNYLDGDILEIGSGIGNISSFFIEDGAQITLSDYEAHYCTILKEKFSKKENVKDILQIDLQHLQFSLAYKNLEKKFDSVFLLNVVEHLKDDNSALSNLSFMLKSGGTLVVLVPAYSFLYSAMDKQLGHYRRYTTSSMTLKFIKNGFAIKKAFYFNFLGIGAWSYGKLMGIKRIPGSNMSLFNRLTGLGKILDKLVLKKAGLSVIVVGIKK